MYYKNVVVAPWLLSLIEENQSTQQLNGSNSYSRVPLIYRAVHLRAELLKRLPYYVGDTPADETELGLTYGGRKIRLSDLIFLTEIALLVRGGSLLVRLQNSYKIAQGYQFINPMTVHIEHGDDAVRYYQIVNGKRYPATGYWVEGKDAHLIREFSLDSDVGFGVSAAEVALGGARTLHYLERLAATFFERGAMPVSVMVIPANAPDGERNRLETFLRNAVSGVANAWRVLVMRGSVDTKLETFTQNFKDMAIPDVREHAIDDVAWAFGVPRTLLTASAANYATANQDAMGFLTNTIIPRAQMLVSELQSLGINVRCAPEELTELQEDENQRATAFATYVSAGMDKRIAAEILGIDIPESVAHLWESEDNNEIMDSAAVQNEVRAFERYAQRRIAEGHPEKIKNFKFRALPAERQAELLARYQSQMDTEAQPSDTGAPFRYP